MSRTLLKNEATLTELPLYRQTNDHDNPSCSLENDQCPAARLRTSLAHERALVDDKNDMILRQDLLMQEADHRLSNSLQMIASLLMMQARSASSAEVTSQLASASARVAALGRIHQRLHNMDSEVVMAFKPYLEGICADISAMLWTQDATTRVCVKADDIILKSAAAVPLGFIANELVTNAAKYGSGSINVAFARRDANACTLTVMNDGPPLPEGFSPENVSGLGMKIISAFLKQLDGELDCGPGAAGKGARFTIVFPVAP